MSLKHHVFICENDRAADDPRGSCVARGSAALRAHAKAQCHARGLKGSVRINSAGCLDACAQGPVIVVYGAENPPQGVWYTANNEGDIDAIIDEHLVAHTAVARLRMRKVEA